MKLLQSYFANISTESMDTTKVPMTQENVQSIVEDTIKAILGLEVVDLTKSFADLGFTPDQYTDLINKVNTALGTTIDIDTKFESPAEMIKSILGTITQPLVAKEIWNGEEFKGYIDEVVALEKQLELMTNASEEGFGTTLVKALASAGDIFIRMGNSFKTSVTRFAHAVKRSEIKMYYESNMLKVSKVENTSFDTFKELEVDKPVGMKGNFMDAVKAVNKTYTALDIYTFAAAVEKHLKDMRLLIARDSKNFSQLNTILQVIKTREQLMTDEKKTIEAIFTDKGVDSVEDFDKLYRSMEEFKEVRELLIAMMPRIDEATRLNDCVDECDSALQDIIVIVEQDAQIDKGIISNLLEITKYMSAACSFYGENVSRQLALEHNHVCNIQTCWQAIR